MKLCQSQHSLGYSNEKCFTTEPTTRKVPKNPVLHIPNVTLQYTLSTFQSVCWKERILMCYKNGIFPLYCCISGIGWSRTVAKKKEMKPVMISGDFTVYCLLTLYTRTSYLSNDRSIGLSICLSNILHTACLTIKVVERTGRTTKTVLIKRYLPDQFTFFSFILLCSWVTRLQPC